MSRSLRLVTDPHPDGAHPEKGPIRVVLAVGHEAVLRSLRQVLDGEDNIEVVGEAQDLESLMRQMSAPPRVLALDLSLSGRSGIETLRQVRKEAPNTEIVVLTMNDDPDLAAETLNTGASAFVLKDMADTELPTAVRSAAAGQRYVSPRVAARLAQRGDLA
jgi:two-component system response regulator NreC